MKIEALYEIFKSHSSISTDTRKITENCLFFALKGDTFNGNKFAKDAIDKGAAYSIIDKKEYKVSDQYILVNDVLETLQQLANYHRKQFNIPFIGITGTNGKTTTKEFVNAVLSKKFKTSFTQGNLNNHIGVPLTLLSIPSDCEIAIIEMGANHVGEIGFLCKIAEPNYGIITNIGTAHIEGFGSIDNIKKTKNELYQFVQSVNGKIFVNAHNQILIDLSYDLNKITYGTVNADCNGKLLSSTPSVKLEWNDETITSKLYGSYNYENILAAICIANYFKVPSNEIKEAIEEYEPTNNRSQIIEIGKNTLFLDAYNANPTSMNAAINTFIENDSDNKLMILGDMLELGNISQSEHQKIVDKVKEARINTLFVGNEFNTVSNKYDYTYLKNVGEIIDWLKHSGLINYQILIKGSRGIHLEGIVEYLQKKGS
ncbi:MAG: UDP-N-acetylmuramoyl-tripeptide--D-alanyl-D-alanine ligase [Flavobacteriales bacterium]|nr:UDP-N-acetylmuramoyl-tripeptide--D-alanyl-D-alanine ligase [Flavobacteriales bacterium]